MQPTPNSPIKKGKLFLKTTHPNNLPEAKKNMPPRERRRKTGEPRLHKLADKLTEILIYFIIIFSPWAFGATESWSIWTINISSYSLGIIFIAKWLVRRNNTKKTILDINNEKNISPKQNHSNRIHKVCNILLNIFILFLLGYVLTSALNARASFSYETKMYTYFEDYNQNLPHSYDCKSTWLLFWQYLGLACLFWATQDWLIDYYSTAKRKSRIKKLLLTISFNAIFLALECIFQRIYFGLSTGKLLFLIEPNMIKMNVSQFGPFSYRSNASSYFNLIWPLGLGLYMQMATWHHSIKDKLGGNISIMLVPSIILSLSAPIISSARGGALITIALIIISLILILFQKNKRNLLPLLTIIFGIILAYKFGWNNLSVRLVDIFIDNFSSRIEIIEYSLKMAKEYPIFGSGPGTFQSIAQFEMQNGPNSWDSWVHCDYIEFLITFGWPGVTILLLIIILLAIKLLLNLIKTEDSKILNIFGLLAIIGVGAHATLDFPLQVLSILIVIVIISALISLNKESV